MSQPKTSQNEEELLSYSCYGTGWFEECAHEVVTQRDQPWKPVNNH